MTDFNKEEEKNFNRNDLNNESFKLYTQEEIEKLKKEGSSFASYSNQNEGTGSIPSAVVLIEGKEAFTQGGHLQIKLTQRTLETSTFEIRCREDEFEPSGNFPFTSSKYLLGNRIYISFKQFGQTAFSFTGLITGLEREKQGQDGYLVLFGCSPDILLQGGQVYRSFENKTLEEIIQEVCQGLPLDLFSLTTKPKYKERIPYLVQYRETSLQYIQRLAKRYGEWLYWKGES